jgi:hypothetical protein
MYNPGNLKAVLTIFLALASHSLIGQDLLVYRYTRDFVIAPKEPASSLNYSKYVLPFKSDATLSPAFFCRMERKLMNHSGRQILFRLVSVDEIDRLEGKLPLIPGLHK